MNQGAIETAITFFIFKNKREEVENIYLAWFGKIIATQLPVLSHTAVVLKKCIWDIDYLF